MLDNEKQNRNCTNTNLNHHLLHPGKLFQEYLLLLYLKISINIWTFKLKIAWIFLFNNLNICLSVSTNQKTLWVSSNLTHTIYYLCPFEAQANLSLYTLYYLLLAYCVCGNKLLKMSTILKIYPHKIRKPIYENRV